MSDLGIASSTVPLTDCQSVASLRGPTVLTKLVRGERYDGPNTSRVMGGEMGGEEAAAMNIEAEGSILLSTTVVNRTFVFQQLRQTVERLRGVGAIR